MTCSGIDCAYSLQILQSIKLEVHPHTPVMFSAAALLYCRLGLRPLLLAFRGKPVSNNGGILVGTKGVYGSMRPTSFVWGFSSESDGEDGV